MLFGVTWYGRKHKDRAPRGKIVFTDYETSVAANAPPGPVIEVAKNVRIYVTPFNASGKGIDALLAG